MDDNTLLSMVLVGLKSPGFAAAAHHEDDASLTVADLAPRSSKTDWHQGRILAAHELAQMLAACFSMLAFR